MAGFVQFILVVLIIKYQLYSATNHTFTFRLLSVTGSDNIRHLFSFRSFVWTWASAVDMVEVSHAKQNTHIRNMRDTCTGPFTDSKLH